MGVGGGFIMVPAMIYLLGVPTKVVIGTSLFQIIFVAYTTIVQHTATDRRHGAGLRIDGRRRHQRNTAQRPGKSYERASCARCWRCSSSQCAVRLAFDLFLPPNIYSMRPGI